MSELTPEEQHDRDMRRALFTVCKSKEDLHRWIKVFIGLDFPDTIVDEKSNSSPMDAIWEAYDKALKNNDPTFSRVMWVASRDSGKTLSAAVFEVLSLLHLGRDVGHMAAIKGQAQKSQQYLKQAFRNPYLRDYLISNNTERTEVAWYMHKKTGYPLTVKQYAALTEAEKKDYEQHERYAKIVVCSMTGANCVDPTSLIHMADGTHKLAVEVQPGDEVRSFNLSSKKWVTNRIGGVGLTEKQGMLIRFEDGGSVVVSDDEPLLTNRGWTRAWALKKYSRLFVAGPSVEAKRSFQPLVDQVTIKNPRMVLLGTLLGDASIVWPKNKKREMYGRAPRLRFSHSEAQEEYLLQKAKALDLMGVPYTILAKDANLSGEIKKNKSFLLQTRTHESLIEIHGLFYPNGAERKTVTRELLDQLDEEALAYWLMDDVRGNGHEVGKVKDAPYQLATCGFTTEENSLIVELFKTKWGLDCSIGDVTNQSKKRYEIIQFTLDASRKLTELVQEYFPASMRYKLVPPHGYIQGQCIECGDFTDRGDNPGFVRCERHPYRSNDRAYRKMLKDFKKHFTGKISSIEFIGRQTFVDIKVDTSDEQEKNFVVNGGILAHNSDHVPTFVVDEIDVIPKQNQQAYEEAKSIPGSFNGLEPISVLTSTRKFAFGNVQREIEAADKSGLHLRLWNIIDFTAACLPDRHKPEEPKVTLYVNNDDLKHITEKEYEDLPQERKKPYEPLEGYAGCATCPLFVACKGQLATKQKVHPVDENGKFTNEPKPLLKSINFTINKFRELSLDMAKAQLLCWLPSREGLIYSGLDKDKHLLTADQLATFLTGEEHRDLTPEAFMRMLKQRHGRFVSGIDFGFTHMFSVVLGYVEGPICIVLGSWQAPELDPAEKVDLLNRTIKEFNPRVYADTEAPDMVKFLKKYGYRCAEWKKGPGSVIGGIEIVRHKLNPTMLGKPELFFLDGGPGIDQLFTEMSMYHWEIGQDGKPTDVPDEVVIRTDEGVIGDDSNDALRYMVMNVFNKAKSGLVAAADEDSPALPSPTEVESFQAANKQTNQNWARQVFSHVLGEEDVENTPSEGPQKKGGLFWDI